MALDFGAKTSFELLNLTVGIRRLWDSMHERGPGVRRSLVWSHERRVTNHR